MHRKQIRRTKRENIQIIFHASHPVLRQSLYFSVLYFASSSMFRTVFIFLFITLRKNLFYETQKIHSGFRTWNGTTGI